MLASTRDVTIELRAAQPAPFTGDEDLVHRLVGNLLDNAIRHAPAGTAVLVDLGRDGTVYTITVTDRGPGIPPAIQPHIFERFYRGDAARGHADGAGLGLAVTRWIATVHHGDVALTRSSEAGTTFTARLPSPVEADVQVRLQSP